MKLLPLLLLAILSISASAAISHLNDRNFIAKVNESPFTLVYFYSSSCKYCKEFTPKFQRVSKNSELINAGISFAKIDSPTYQNFTRSYQVYSYPTIALFAKGIPLPIYYRKEREEKPLIDYVLKVIKPFDQSQLLETFGKLSQEHMIGNKYAIFRGKRDSVQFKIWDFLVKRDGYIQWAFAEDETPKVVIGNHEITDFSNMTELQLKIESIYARLHRITEESWLKMADKRVFTIVYINKHGNRKTRKLLEGLAKDLPTVHFLQIDGEDDDYKQALRFFGMNDEQNIISFDKLYDATYVAPSPYTQSGLKDFIQKAKDHKLQLYRKTQNSDKPNKLTRNNYEQKMSTNQDVLIFLYDRSEQISKELMNLFEFLLVKLKKNKNLLLLRCDIKLNEVEQKLGFLVKHTPKLVYFRNKQKDYPIHFSGKTISPQTVIDFIMENTTFDFEQEWAEL